MSSDEYAFWERKLLGSFDWFDLEYLKYEAFLPSERVHRGSAPMKLSQIRDAAGVPRDGGRGSPGLIKALQELTKASGPFRTTITHADGSHACGKFWPMPPTLRKK